jgi:outer membrane protein TolC
MPRIAGESGGDGVQAVVLALRILEYLAPQRDAVGVTALAQALGTTKSRIYRHLRTLVQQGYIVQSAETERYRVGAISIVDLVQARGDFERAETDRITAVYDVQRAFAALENAVGRPLR